MGWVETYLNNAIVKHDLGVNPETEFKSCNMEVNQAFMAQADGMHNSASVLPELLESGVRLLVYAGEWHLGSVHGVPDTVNQVTLTSCVTSLGTLSGCASSNRPSMSVFIILIVSLF